MSWWVGGIIEAGMGSTGSRGTPYLPFVFEAPNQQSADKEAHMAKLLAGPFNSRSEAQNWANAYEKNPNTLHAGNDLSKSKSVVKGDKAPPGASGALSALQGINEIGSTLDAGFRQVTKVSMWRSMGWIALGGGMVGLGIIWWTKTEGVKVARGLISNPSGKPQFSAPVLPLTMMMTGLYLVWFGVKYFEDTSVIWPSDPVKAVLQGKSMPARKPDASAIELLASSEQAVAAADKADTSATIPNSGSGSSFVPSGSILGQAKALMIGHKWDIGQLAPLQSLWNQESGWNPKARNPASGAFGIAQALGHGNANTAAPDGTNEYGGYGLSDAQARSANAGVAYWQMVWGMNYIHDTYGTPAGAWNHEQTHNWY